MTHPSNTSSGESDERAAFEAHFKHLSLMTHMDPWLGLRYSHSIVQDLWEGWQARAALQSKACASVGVESMPLGAIQQIIDTVQRIKEGAEAWPGGWSGAASTCDTAILQLQIVSGIWAQRNVDYANVVKQCAALASLRTALEFYASPSNWTSCSSLERGPAVDEDSGDKARAALNQTPAAPAATEAPSDWQAKRDLMDRLDARDAGATPAPAVGVSPEPASERESFLLYCKAEMIPKQLLQTDAHGDYPNPPVGEMWKAWKKRGALTITEEPDLWQYRTFDSDANAWRDWEEVKVTNAYTQTMQQRIAELLEHRYKGRPTCEVRALAAVGASVQPVLASLSDEQIIRILHRLHCIAFEYDRREYGLPLHDAGAVGRMRWAIRDLASSTPTKGGEAS